MTVPHGSAPRCFVISLHRTGTRSTISLLRQLGLNAKHFLGAHNGVDFTNAFEGQETDLDHVFKIMRSAIESYDAIADVPIPALYPQLSDQYPTASFLLVWRDPEEWVQSVRHHIGSRPLHQLEKIQYWRYLKSRPDCLSDVADEQLVRICLQHKAEVGEFFTKRGSHRLGVFRLESPSIGPDIATFLGLVPKGGFPTLGAANPAVTSR